MHTAMKELHQFCFLFLSAMHGHIGPQLHALITALGLSQ